MTLASRALALGRALLRAISWPFTGEVEHRRESPEEAERALREMTLVNRDQSR